MRDSDIIPSTLQAIRRRCTRRVAATLSPPLVALMLSACATAAVTGPVLALPDGYYLQPDKAFHTLLVDRQGHRVLQATVAAYAVSRELVAGAEGDPPAGSSGSYATDLPFPEDTKARYFILDAAGHRLEQHLDLATWHQRLQALGVPADLRIYPPLRWQQM